MDTVELVGRLIISLGVVVGLIWLIARKVRGGARRKLRSDKLIDVLCRQGLTRTSSVAVVRVADQALIVGITDSSVRVLGDIELDAVQAKIAEYDPTTRRTDTGFTDARVNDTGFNDTAAPSRSPAAGRNSTARHHPTRNRSAEFVIADDIPASPATLAGTLTAADIEAIRAHRTESGSPVSKPPSARPPKDDGALTGSALSPATWRQTIDALRDMTTRKG